LKVQKARHGLGMRMCETVEVAWGL